MTKKFLCIALTLSLLAIPFEVSASPSTLSIPSTYFSYEINLIEQTLDSNGTDVKTELEKALKIFYSDLNNTENISDQKKLQILIEETNFLLEQYTHYTDNQTLAPMDATTDANATIVAAVCAYFSSNGYLLSYELLVQAEKNTSLDSTYIPYYGSRVNSSPIITNLKRVENLNTSGSSSFPNTGSAIQKDLYYAIHSFNYSFTSSGFIITDRYDFASGDLIYTGIEDLAVETMYQLQLSGYLTPYYIRIRA